jgi:hypothetical protein
LQVMKTTQEDNNGILRNGIEFMAADPHYPSDLGGTVLGMDFAFARA